MCVFRGCRYRFNVIVAQHLVLLWYAGATAAALACGDEAASFAGAEPSAKNIANATARALSYVYASCESDDGAYSCANTTAYMVETAKAVGSVCT